MDRPYSNRKWIGNRARAQFQEQTEGDRARRPIHHSELNHLKRITYIHERRRLITIEEASCIFHISGPRNISHKGRHQRKLHIHWCNPTIQTENKNKVTLRTEQ